MHGETDISSPALGKTKGRIHLKTLTEIRTACARMASQATRELRIFSRDLDAPLYDHLDFLEPVRRLALLNPRAPVQILLFDPESAIRSENRLIELARQLTSRIQIRCVPAEFQHRTQVYLLADDQGYLLRQVAEVFEATADFAAPRKVRRTRKAFERAWERSEEPLEFRSFGRGI